MPAGDLAGALAAAPARPPPLPPGTGDTTTTHDATIAYHAIVPPYSGERLNLHCAISVCLTNAENAAWRRRHLQAA